MKCFCQYKKKHKRQGFVLYGLYITIYEVAYSITQITVILLVYTKKATSDDMLALDRG